MNEELRFQRALAPPIDQRAAFLDRDCSDPVFRSRAAALLAAEAALHSPLDHPPALPERTRAYIPAPVELPQPTAWRAPPTTG